MQKVFGQTLTDLTIITAKYVYFHSQNFLVISFFKTERYTQQTKKKMLIHQN